MECISFNPRIRANAPSSFVVTSVSNNSGLALVHENETFNLFDLDEGSNCNDNLGTKLIPRIIMTTNIVLIEKADKRMLILDLMIYDFRFSIFNYHRVHVRQPKIILVNYRVAGGDAFFHADFHAVLVSRGDVSPYCFSFLTDEYDFFALSGKNG